MVTAKRDILQPFQNSSEEDFILESNRRIAAKEFGTMRLS
jgi:hypothetical protein